MAKKKQNTGGSVPSGENTETEVLAEDGPPPEADVNPPDAEGVDAAAEPPVADEVAEQGEAGDDADAGPIQPGPGVSITAFNKRG